jgi:hypothetical protein
MCEYSDAIKLPKSYSPPPPPPPGGEGGQGLQNKSFLADKRSKCRGKKEVAATVLTKTIKYYENTKYTLKKDIKKICKLSCCLSSSRKRKIFSAQL